MKAITIRQPWAWGIIHGGKDIENRDWTTAYRGPLLIHAGKKMNGIDYGDYAERIYNLGLPMPKAEDLRLGGVIGVVELVDVVEKSKSPWFIGAYGFVLKNPRPLPFFPCKGQLNIFNIEVPEF